MISTEFKKQVIDQLEALEKASGQSAKRFAISIGINPSQWSRLKKGKIDNVISDSRLITIARENKLQIGNKKAWHTVKTPTFQYITSLLETCQQECISTLLVDYADIGKSHTAKHYAAHTPNAVYIDCAQVKTKQLLVREIARRFGSKHTGQYPDVYSDLVFYLNTLENALVIIDEAGDLKPDAFLELKALWNATEHNIGWFMMGADGLKAKIKRGINYQKVGYAEIFSRFQSSFKRVSPLGGDELEDFKYKQAVLVAKANAPKGSDLQKLLKASNNSLRNLYDKIQIMNRKSA